MVEPRYSGLRRDQIPSFSVDDARVTVSLISGTWDGRTGPIESLTDVHMTMARLAPGGRVALGARGRGASFSTWCGES
ncbi:MAG: hypothetical protein ABJC61_06440 [Acidobacteriota bacterium]